MTVMKVPLNKRIANVLFEIALKVIGNREDPLNKTWSYLGFALCLPEKEAEKQYIKADVRFNNLSTLCKASFLLEYGEFKYKQGKYKESIEQHINPKQLLEREETDFEAVKSLNYYRICQTYLKLCINDRLTINDTYNIDGSILDDYQECIAMYEKLDLPDKSNVNKLRKEIMRSVSNSDI